MDVRELQRELLAAGEDPGAADGAYGPKTRAALASALTGDPARLTAHDIAEVAANLGLTPAHVGAVCDVESRGAGFDPATRRPIILYEPHIFHRRTGGKWSAGHPTVSYEKWRTRPYPPTQGGRYDQLLTAAGLDPDAAPSSASWGLFQIMGFNAEACGLKTPFAFALAMASSERKQLDAFSAFVRSQGLLDELKRQDWAGFASRYNGPGYEANGYHTKLAAAFKRRGGQ